MLRDWLLVRSAPAPHQLAWLASHPNRSLTWLREQSADGFDVHHVDGNHSNNAPENLILIDHRDHFMLHSGGRPLSCRKGRAGPQPETIRIGLAAKESKDRGMTWVQIGKAMGINSNRVKRCYKTTITTDPLELKTP